MQLRQISLLGSSAALILGLGGGLGLTVGAGPVRAGEPPSYQAPMLGSPTRRVGGGTRGTGEEIPRVYALASKHTGLTLEAQPTLYWGISSDTQHNVEITINHVNPSTPETMMPVLEASVEAPKAGIHALDLAKHEVTLEPGTEYEWFVSLVVDPRNRSQDVLMSGTILRVAEDSKQAACVKEKEGADPVATYASCGLWYDTLAEASRQISEGQAGSTADRIALLNQVGLEDAAKLDQ